MGGPRSSHLPSHSLAEDLDGALPTTMKGTGSKVQTRTQICSLLRVPIVSAVTKLHVCVRMCARACVCMHVYVRMQVRVCACVHMCECKFENTGCWGRNRGTKVSKAVSHSSYLGSKE